LKKVILFGSTGHVGKCVAAELINRGYDLTCVVRTEAKARELHPAKTRVVNATDATTLEGITNGFDVVVSCLGKSVSPNDRSKPTFYDVDFVINSNILSEAIKSKVKKFVYLSALHSERYTHLEYFLVHHEFSEKLMRSGLNYSIIKPPAIFSAFLDVMTMAKQGRLAHLGKGDKLTNPIYEGDLAGVVADSIEQDNVVVEAGGKETLSRRQINEIIQQRVRPGKPIRTIPLGVVQKLLPVIKLFSRNTFDKFAFFVEVSQYDTIAPPIGERRFAEYIDEKLKRA
jgi:uncharacterized protein YbjT (DUF2867 family)